MLPELRVHRNPTNSLLRVALEGSISKFFLQTFLAGLSFVVDVSGNFLIVLANFADCHLDLLEFLETQEDGLKLLNFLDPKIIQNKTF